MPLESQHRCLCRQQRQSPTERPLAHRSKPVLSTRRKKVEQGRKVNKGRERNRKDDEGRDVRQTSQSEQKCGLCEWLNVFVGKGPGTSPLQWVQCDNIRPADPLHGARQSKHGRQAVVPKPAQASGEDRSVCVLSGFTAARYAEYTPLLHLGLICDSGHILVHTGKYE